jgi:subtilase family serine protease
MSVLTRPARFGTAAVAGLATLALAGGYASTSAAAASRTAPQFVSLRNSVSPTTDHATGAYHSARMSIEVALAPRNEKGLERALRAQYTRGSSSYHRWLARGAFDAGYAPTAPERNAVGRYLASAGLKVSASSSPFLLRATGSSQRVEAAFRTSLSTYRDSRGTRYFANASAVRVPSTLSGDVLGVVGLKNTVRLRSAIARQGSPERFRASTSAKGSSCELPYPSESDFFAYANGATLALGYGGGPACSGLTPSQVDAVYGAPKAGQDAKGSGVTVGLFELSAYRKSDISTYAQQFYGSSFQPPLRNINVDGGPLNPVCPSADSCPPSFNGYSGDIEVDADIETSLAVAPDAQQIDVYNAPNDETGQTSLDEWAVIASQDRADTISSSWGECENDVSAGYVQAENVLFEQMAMQGQSVFGASGDTGALDCIETDGTTVQNTDDPPSQPWMTSVGGTSLETYNPGTSANPAAPAPGTETIWNSYNLCSTQPAGASNDEISGPDWCDIDGAGGGGFSQYWGRPFYQRGPGVSNPAYPSAAGTVDSGGITECSLAAAGSPCREEPDVSANADPATGYAEYCTGNAKTPYSTCAQFSGSQPAPGWFPIGGTSLSSPLWAAVIADRDGYQGYRTGNINPLVYLLLSTDPGQYFNDLTGRGSLQQVANNNGIFDVTPGYDMATGAGTPKFAAWITGG